MISNFFLLIIKDIWKNNIGKCAICALHREIQYMLGFLYLLSENGEKQSEKTGRNFVCCNYIGNKTALLASHPMNAPHYYNKQS